MDLVSAELPARTLVVGVEPGKASNRVLLATGERGLIGEPVSVSTQRVGVDRLCELIDGVAAPQTVIAIEATGSLHVSWVAELERRLPGSLRLFAPSETQAARTQLGFRRFKDDDRDCAALISLARQGRRAQLAEPAEQDGRRRGHVDRAEVGVFGVGEMAVAG